MTTMCRRPDEDRPTAWRLLDDDMAWRRCDDSATIVASPGLTCHKPGFGAEPRLMTCHPLGLDAEPGLMTVVALSSHRRGLVVMSSSCQHHAVGLSSSCRRHIVVRSASCRRRAVVVTYSIYSHSVVIGPELSSKASGRGAPHWKTKPGLHVFGIY